MSYMTALSHAVSAGGQLPMGSGLPPATQGYMSRVSSLPEAAYTAAQMYPGQRAVDNGANSYPAMSSGGLKSASSLGQHYFVDAMMNPHPYSSLYPGFDMSSVRRKNATRETTGPLKAWLSQHRKNPYPTKGEKVMLAIATRMTLTQVSTWFANARRRMKKDINSDEEEDNKESDDDKVRSRSGSLSSRLSQTSSEADISRDSDTSQELDQSDTDDIIVASRPVKKCVQRLFSPDLRPDFSLDPSSSPESLPDRQTVSITDRLPPMTEMMTSLQFKTGPVTVLTSERLSPPTTSISESQKPKIWSISEIMNTANKTVETHQSYSTGATHDYANTYSVYNNQGYPSNGATDYFGSYMNMLYGSGQATNNTAQTSDPVQYL
ncbi:iroquois-class homeodomain protein irx-2-like [Mya arenaria]|uniref:iroquois-class homeodomain protein irx-2-like n=1 Tax=Mya arenaria TaxID=6604 RepID=UPI0022E84C15|nr:iroquois-class homeodomain protein irx-2-like [Mya arenaria]